MLLLLMCVMFSTQVFAKAGSTLSPEVKAKCQQILREDAARNDGVLNWKLAKEAELRATPRYICLNCEWFCVTVCDDTRKFDSSGYHSTALTKDCKMTVYKSGGAMMCPTCYTIWERYGDHYCWESHTKCSKGEYDICPMQES